MYLTKKQALDLVKVLAHYELSRETVDVDHVALREEIEGFLTEEEGDDEDEQDDCEEGCCEDEEDPDEEDEEELDEQEDEEGDEDDEPCEEHAVKAEELDTCSGVRGARLGKLTPLSARIISSSVGQPSDKVRLEFEEIYGSVDLICSEASRGSGTISDVIHVKRTGSELYVAEDINGDLFWHRFSVSKYPSDWVSTMACNLMYEID